MNKKLPVEERTFLLIVFVNAFIFALFFGSLLTGGNIYDRLSKASEEPIHAFEFPENPDNVYLWTDSTPSADTQVRIYHSDGTVTSHQGIPSSGIGDKTKGYTSDLFTSTSGISKVVVVDAPEGLKAGSINSGNLLAAKSDFVLGTSTGEYENELLFLEKSGIEVISRDEWGADPQEINDETEKVNIESIDVYSISNESNESDLDALRTTYNYHLSRCNLVPGIAPVSCTEDETWTDISYNYIIGFDGDVYQGRVGGNGVAGLHEGENGDSISVAMISRSGEHSEKQIEVSRSILTILASMNGFDLGPTTLTAVNASDQVGFESTITSMYQVEEVVVDEEEIIEVAPVQEIVQISKEAEELVEDREFVQVGDEVQVLVSSDVNADAEEVLERAGAEELEEIEDGVSTTMVDEDIVEQTITEVMVADEEAAVQLNYIYRIDSWDNSDPDRSVPSDYTTGTHWNYEKINAPEVWKDMGGCTVDNSCGGDQSVIVAVLDTGVAYEDYNFDAGDNFTAVRFDPFWVEIPAIDTPDSDYNEGYDREYNLIPEFSNINFVSPYDAWQDYSCNSLRLTGGSPDPCNAAEAAKINHPNDDHGHGSFVTSIIAANTSDAAPNNIVGIAHNVSIMPVKVFTPNDKSMCQDSYGDLDPTCSYIYGDYRSVAFTTTLVDGIDHARINGANVINMSLGGPGTDSLVEAAIDDAVTAGILVVVASGNDGDDTEYYFPANAPGAFTVGATDDSDTIASYSNTGDEVSLVAPVGGSSGSITAGIRYTCSTTATCDDETNPNLFQSFTSDSSPNKGIGTSYAAPQVAAAAALLWSDDPSATLAEIEAALRNSAIDLGTAGWDSVYGYGMLDIEAALAREEKVLDPPPEPPPPPPPPPAEPNDEYFTWYDTSQAARSAWVLVGNPSSSQTASVNIRIGNSLSQSYSLSPGSQITPEWRGVKDGPVIVTSNNPIYSSQRVIFNGSFNEFSGITAGNLTNKYYFTWYDTSNASRSAWVLVGNPSASQTASVNIKVGNILNQNYSIPPGGSIQPLWSNIQGGPVTVTSNIDVYATQRVLFNGYFNEFAGIPATALTNKYYFTWYDTSNPNRSAWVLVGNPSSSQEAFVNIKVGNQIDQHFAIPPGGSIQPIWTGVQAGPVTVSSNYDVYATQRVLFNGAFNEFSGIPADTLGKKYYFTWYDTSQSSRQAWILVGNPSSSNTAFVNIKVGNQINQNFAVPPGGNITPSWPGIIGGPVIVTSNYDVYATQRVVINGDFNEYPGIPQ